MSNCKSKKREINSFQDNSPISENKNNLFNTLFTKAKGQKEQAKDNNVAEEKFANIFIWSSEGLVQKELTCDDTDKTFFVKDPDNVLFRKLGSQWFTGNYVGVLSLGNDCCIEIYSR